MSEWECEECGGCLTVFCGSLLECHRCLRTVDITWGEPTDD